MPSPADTPARLAVFLRGINLGNRRVKKEALAAPFRSAGFTGVEPYLASGNVVVDAPDPSGTGDLGIIEERVEAAVRKGLGFEADAFVRTLEALSSLSRLDHLLAAEAEGFTPHVLFLKAAPDPVATEALGSLEGPDDRFPILGREVLWLRRGGLSDAPVQPRHLERALGGAPHTLRKVTTLRRLGKKYG